MASKCSIIIVLLAILTAYILTTSSGTSGLPSWPLFRLSVLLDRGITWLEQALTPPHIWLTKEMTGFATSKAIYIACELGFADILSKGPLTAKEIAIKSNTDPDRTERVLKFLAVQGVFDRTNTGIYSNNAASDYLRDDHPQSHRPLCLHLGNEVTAAHQKHLDSMYDPSSLPFHTAFGTDKDFWEFLDDPQNAKMRENFDKTMVNLALGFAPSLVSDYPWHKHGNAQIVNVGGGIGHLVAEVLQAHPSFTGLIYDVEKDIESAKQELPALYPEVMSRLTFIKGSFFESVPVNGDVYILKRILRDWKDDACIKILHAVATSMHETQKVTSKTVTLLIIEHLYDHETNPGNVAFFDMVMFGREGKERSLEEFRVLVEKVGLKVSEVYDTRSMLAVLECVLV